MLLLAAEGGLVTLLGVVLGAVLSFVAVVALRGWVESSFGIVLQPGWPQRTQWLMMAAVLAAGWLASLVPGYRAYRMSLADGLSPRI